MAGKVINYSKAHFHIFPVFTVAAATSNNRDRLKNLFNERFAQLSISFRQEIAATVNKLMAAMPVADSSHKPRGGN